MFEPSHRQEKSFLGSLQSPPLAYTVLLPHPTRGLSINQLLANLCREARRALVYCNTARGCHLCCLSSVHTCLPLKTSEQKSTAHSRLPGSTQEASQGLTTAAYVSPSPGGGRSWLPPSREPLTPYRRLCWESHRRLCSCVTAMGRSSRGVQGSRADPRPAPPTKHCPGTWCIASQS